MFFFMYHILKLQSRDTDPEFSDSNLFWCMYYIILLTGFITLVGRSHEMISIETTLAIVR